MTLEWIPAWLASMPLVAGMVGVWIGATFFWIRVARVPTAIAVAVAPAVTGTLILFVSLVYSKLGWFWSGARVLPALVVIGGLGALTYWLVQRKWGPIPSRLVFGYREPTGGLPRPRVSSFALACLVGWVLAILPTILVSSPDNPVQQWDSSFHMNGVWGITQLGIAAPGEGLAHNYGGSPNRDYPIGWHAFTSLFATPETTVAAANASSLAIMAIWVAGVGILAHTLYPGRTIAFVAPIISGVLPSMPADALTMYSQWPNALSVAYLPGIVALAVIVGRNLIFRLTNQPNTSGWGTLAASGIVLLAAVFGAIEAHPVVAFNMLVLLGPAVAAGGVTLWRFGKAERKLSLLVAVPAIAVAGIAVVIAVIFTPEVESMRNYVRNGVDLPTAFSQVFTPMPPFPKTFGLALLSAALTALAVVGIVRIVAARHARTRATRWVQLERPVLWPAWSYALFLTLVFFAYGPDWEIRKWIVGPWFSDGRRIMEPMSIPLAILAAVGFEWLTIWLVRLWNKTTAPGTSKQRGMAAAFLGTVLFVGTVFGGMDGRLAGARYVMDTSSLGKPGMATQGVLDMMRTLPDLLPEDAVVLGDPQAGAVYAQMIGQRWAYFPQLSLLNGDRAAQAVIVKRFRDIHSDPEVCQAIRDQGITHYFSSPDGFYYNTRRSDRMPGLYDVDTSQGFELVASGDDARLYRITACD